MVRDGLQTDGDVDGVRADARARARRPCPPRAGSLAAARRPATARVSVRDTLGDADDDVGELEGWVSGGFQTGSG